MRKILPLLFLLLAGCQPASPTLPPTQSLREIQTAAASTVESVMKTAAATPPAPIDTPDLTALPLPSDATVTPIVVATSHPGEQTTGEFWVTYVSLGSVWVAKSDGSRSTRLTNTPAQDYLPQWSPDGKYLAYLRFYGSDSLNGNLMVLPADSNTPELLTPDMFYTSVSWLPDSHTLLAVSGDLRLPDSYLIDVETKEARKLDALSGGQPLLSPDGKKIAALVAETLCRGENCLSPGDLFIHDLATGETKQFTSDSSLKEWLAWSPDSTKVAYYVRDTDRSLREIVTIDGSLTVDRGPVPWWAEVIYALSPDKKEIAYATPTSADGMTQVLLIPFGMENDDARPIARLTKADQGFDPYIDLIRWLPDSSAVVFDNLGTLFVAPTDGSGFKELPIEMEKTTFDLIPTNSGYNPPPEPTLPASMPICPGGIETRLDVGLKASVSTSPPSPNNVRNGPSKNNSLIGQIQPGEVVEILRGPECEDGFIWWEVRSESTGLKGWTVEGDRKSYWLVPEP